MLDTGIEAYRNIEAFFTRYPEARRSPESDYGVWWKGPDGGNWRVSYVHDTGHVYGIRLGGTSSGTLAIGLQEELSFVSASDGSQEGPVVILGQLPSFTREREDAIRRQNRAGVAPPPEIEEALEGWAEQCGRQGSLAWAHQAVQEWLHAHR